MSTQDTVNKQMEEAKTRDIGLPKLSESLVVRVLL